MATVIYDFHTSEKAKILYKVFISKWAMRWRQNLLKYDQECSNLATFMYAVRVCVHILECCLNVSCLPIQLF